MKKLLLFITLFSFSEQVLLANSRIDSILTQVNDYSDCIVLLTKCAEEELEGYLKHSSDEQVHCKLYNALCWKNFNSNPPKAMRYAKLQKPIAEKLNNQDALINSYDNMAYLYSGFGDNDKAIEFMLKSLKSKEAINDTAGVSVSLSGLAGVYYKMNNFDLALKYFQQVYKVEKNAGRNNRVTKSLGNIGLCYMELGQLDKGLESYFEAIDLNNEMGKEEKINASIYGNVGITYMMKKDYLKALTYFKKAAKFHEESGDVSKMSNAYSDMAKVYSLQNNFTNALVYGKKAVKYAKLSEDKNKILSSNANLANIFYQNKNYQMAYEHFKIAFEMKDSIFNETSSKQIAEMQTKYDTEKKEAENSLLLAEKELDKAELEKRSTQQRMLGIGLGLSLIIVFYVAYSLNQKKKINKVLNAKNEEISFKNEIIEEKNRDITDSINYAQRIQDAILPEKEVIQNHFKSFIYYRPKDIVSGDFYWAKQVGNKIYFAVVDCTGHGVPGAFMSIIGYNSLNRIVDDFKVTNTGKILDELNKLVVKALEKQMKEGGAIRDGMDLSICCIDLDTNCLEFSGANNGLYVIRRKGKKIRGVEPVMENDQSVFYEIKPDKMAIGGGENEKSYTSHLINLKEEDNVILFSDGFPDQFGGPKGKKFMYKRFKEMLFSMHHMDADEQEKFINTTLEDWMGEQEQLDDICIMGVKIS